MCVSVNVWALQTERVNHFFEVTSDWSDLSLKSVYKNICFNIQGTSVYFQAGFYFGFVVVI